MIPGMDNIQKNYYFQKYEITMKVLTKSAICYHWLIQIITEVFRQLCTMKYAHMNKVFQYIENNKNNEIVKKKQNSMIRKIIIKRRYQLSEGRNNISTWL